VSEGIKRKNFKQGKVEYPIFSAINIGIAGTSAPSQEDRKKYHIYSTLHIAPEKIKLKHFELGKVAHPTLSGSGYFPHKEVLDQ